MRRWIEAGIVAAAIGITTVSCGNADNNNQQVDIIDSTPFIDSNGIGEFRSKYLGYTLKYPVNWAATTQSEGYSYIDTFQFNGGDYDSSLILISVIPFDKEMSLDSYVDSAVGAGLPEPIDGPEIDGVESKIIDIYEIMGEKSQMIIFVKNGVAYNIEYFASADELETTKEVLDGMISSFHVVEPPKTPAPDSEAGYY